MEFDALVAQITERVAAKIAQAQGGDCCGEKPKLLVLGEQAGRCARALESAGVCARYDIECAELRGETPDLDRYAAVILFDLGPDALAKIGGGIPDSPYTALAVEAILSGRRVFVPKEEIALFRYRDTAPQPYYQMLCNSLNILAASGVTFCPLAELKGALEDGGAGCPAEKVSGGSCPAPMAQKQWEIDKRVATEKDVIEACMSGATCLLVGPKTIVTDLARDYAKARKVAILKK